MRFGLLRFGSVDLKLGFYVGRHIGGVKGKGQDGKEEQTFFHGNVGNVIGISGQIETFAKFPKIP